MTATFACNHALKASIWVHVPVVHLSKHVPVVKHSYVDLFACRFVPVCYTDKAFANRLRCISLDFELKGYQATPLDFFNKLAVHYTMHVRRSDDPISTIC